MTKHTPGPWQVCGASKGKCGCGLVWSRHADAVVAQAGLNGHSDVILPKEERFANAHLIAAAPDLLEALNWILWCASGIGKAGGPPTDGEFVAALNAGKTAVTKAQGMEPTNE